MHVEMTKLLSQPFCITLKVPGTSPTHATLRPSAITQAEDTRQPSQVYVRILAVGAHLPLYPPTRIMRASAGTCCHVQGRVAMCRGAETDAWTAAD